MFINKPSVTKIEAADRVNLSTVQAAGLSSTNHENLVKCLYTCPDMRHFMAVTKKTQDCFSDIEIKHWITLLNQDRF